MVKIWEPFFYLEHFLLHCLASTGLKISQEDPFSTLLKYSRCLEIEYKFRKNKYSLEPKSPFVEAIKPREDSPLGKEIFQVGHGSGNSQVRVASSWVMWIFWGKSYIYTNNFSNLFSNFFFNLVKKKLIC